MLDSDGSDGIDFEEFLEVVHHQFVEGSEKSGMFLSGFEKLYEQSTRKKTGCNRLSITAQLNANLI